MWGLRLAIFTRLELSPFVTHVESALEATGVGNTLRNKGGVGIAFRFYETSMCFVCSHLAAHQV